MTRSELKKIIREEYKKAINESSEYDLFVTIGNEYESLYKKLTNLAKNTNDPNWKKALTSLILDLSKWEDKCLAYNSKLGIIPGK